MGTISVRENGSPAGIRRSFTMSKRDYAAPSGTGRRISYGDKIFVRLERTQYGRCTLAEFTLTDVNDMSEIYGELRRYTRGKRGLTQLYVRNVSRGWSMQQPFMLYNDERRVASSVTRPVAQPQASQLPAQPQQRAGRRELPESIRLLFGDH